MMNSRFRLSVARAARLATIIVLIFVFVPVAQSGPVLPQNGTNLLTNGGFETFADGVAYGWDTWWDLSGENMGEPKYQMVSGTDNVHAGSRAQRVGSYTYKNHNGGLYQQVGGLTVGHAVSFSIWHWWPDDFEGNNQAVTLWIGIDPLGGTDPGASSVESSTVHTTNTWQQMRVTTTVSNTTVTVFLGSKPDWAYTPGAVPEGYVIWDDAVLTSGPWQHGYLPLIARNYVPPCTLLNGGFEGTYAADPPYSNKVVAPHWKPWYHWEQDVLADPEYNETTWPLERVRSGDKSQQYGTTWKAHEAGVYQQIGGCSDGTKVRFQVWGQSFVAREIYTSVSDPDGDLRMKIGIDPTGGTDYSSGDVVWSDTVVSRDTWYQFEITATVAGSAITVFTHSYTANTPIEQWFHNTSYWDDATLGKLP